MPETDLIKMIQNGYNLPIEYFETEIRKANDVATVVYVTDLEQLTGTRFKQFYVRTDSIRGKETIQKVERILNNPSLPYAKLFFSGFTGSGKTTELIKLAYNLTEQFNIVIFSVLNKLNIDLLTTEAMIMEIVEDVLNYITLNGFIDEKDPELMDITAKITRWYSETIKIQEKVTEKNKSIGAGIDLLKGLFFSAKTNVSITGSTKEQSVITQKQKLPDLIFECNRLFSYLKQKTGRNTLFIIDDLEKVPYLTARDFYLRSASHIKDLRCSMIMTVPVELVYSSDYAPIEGVFGEAEVLPMVKVKDRAGNPYQPGIDLLKEILEKRIDLSLFEKECYLDAIKYSGGSIRELLRIIRGAALIETTNQVTCVSINKSILDYKDKFSSRIMEREDISFDELLAVLFDIYNGNKERPEKNKALIDLLRTRAVMKYNDKGFYDTHPLLDDFIKAYLDKRGMTASDDSRQKSK